MLSWLIFSLLFLVMTVTSLPIAVLMGGPSSEREVSLATGRAVARGLREAGVEVVHEVDVTSKQLDLPEGTALAFNCLHGTFGEDGQAQQLLKNLGIPGTGAGVEASQLAFDKLASKERFLEAGVPTPEFCVVGPDQIEQNPPIAAPCVVKPTREGSSVGVHIVESADQWLDAAKETAKHGCPLLVEKFVAGRELTVGILGGVALPVLEILPKNGFFDMANKYPWMSEQQSEDQGSEYLCPAPLTAEEEEIVQEVALKAHESLGVDVLSRVDVLLDEEGNPWVLEVNTIPGMTETSLLPKAAAVVGISFADLCLRIASLSLE